MNVRRSEASGKKRRRVALCCGLLLQVLPCAAFQPDLDLGPLFFRGSDIESNELVRAAGPLFEYRGDEPHWAMRAIRPFHSVLREEERERELHEVLWPVGMLKYHQNETYWRFLIAYGHDFDTRADASRYRVVVFPVWFNGRDTHGENYFALFPLGGRINEFLGRDTMSFVLFPLYGYSRINDVESRTVLWPIISRTSGPNIDKFRVFPFYGVSEKKDRWTKRFVLWPFWTSARYHEPDRQGSGFILFPLYGHLKIGEDTESWMVIPPLFRFSKNQGHTECYAPWPLFQYASGEYEKLYLWPFWGRKSMGPVDSWFCVWPIMSGERIQRDEVTANRFLFLPFVQHETHVAVSEATDSGQEDDAAEAASRPDYRYLKLWPLFNYQRREERTDFRLLALWPFKNARSVDRNYAPLWTLYSHTTTAEAKEDELLWGLVRWRRSSEGDRSVTVFPLFSDRKTCEGESSRSWRFLLGLAGYEREGTRKTYRLLYLLKWQSGVDDAEP